jgi:NADH dehydrogenase
MTTLILGMTGHLQGSVARRLLAQGKPVRAMTRTPEKLTQLADLGVEVIQGDLRDPDSLTRACAGATAVINASTAFASKGANTARAVDLDGALALIEAARAAGVHHFVQTSIYGARHNHPIDIWRYKYTTEQRLKNSGLSYSIVQPIAFMELWMEVLAGRLMQNKPAMIFGGGMNPVNFVSHDDVATFLLIALDDPSARNQTIVACGPENLSCVQLVETVGRAAKRPVTLTRIPLPMLRVLSVAVRPFNEMFARQAASGVMMDTTNMAFDPAVTLTRYPISLSRAADVAQRLYAPGVAGIDALSAHQA